MIPFISRYLGKIYPFNWETLYRNIIYSINNTKHKKNKARGVSNHYKLYISKKRKLLKYSLLLSIISSAIIISILSKISYYLNINNPLIEITFLIINILFLLMFEIDKRYYIIPDIFSYPLILFSILFNMLLIKNVSGLKHTSLASIFSVSGIDSAFGGIYGYFSAVIISIIFHKKYKNAFGNGDIKLLAGVGVLIGIDKLYQVILISFVLFFIYSILLKKRYIPYATVLYPSLLLHIIFNFA